MAKGRGRRDLRTRTTAKGETQFAIYYRDRDTGRQSQRTLAARTLKDAKKEVRATLAAADSRTAVAPSRVTIDSVADELVASMESRVNAGQTAPRTLETLVHRLKPVRRTLGRREVQRVTPDACAKIGHDLGSSAFIALRRVLSFAVRRGYLATNPCDSLGARRASVGEVRRGRCAHRRRVASSPRLCGRSDAPAHRHRRALRASSV